MLSHCDKQNRQSVCELQLDGCRGQGARGQHLLAVLPVALPLALRCSLPLGDVFCNLTNKHHRDVPLPGILGVTFTAWKCDRG
jgi:hypothetical protein